MTSEEAGNARKGIAALLKVHVPNVGHPASYARYATPIMKFSPASHEKHAGEIKLREAVPLARTVLEKGRKYPAARGSRGLGIRVKKPRRNRPENTQ
ncbi:MAG: hypothetical protein IJ935_15470 [Afipia sp.]|nr:hypothetical protein [Pseudoalteromonas sp. NZS100_1]MBR2120016.1 hypothetical protein [Afipia sp.]